jgi:hypothetical protein
MSMKYVAFLWVYVMAWVGLVVISRSCLSLVFLFSSFRNMLLKQHFLLEWGLVMDGTLGGCGFFGGFWIHAFWALGSYYDNRFFLDVINLVCCLVRFDVL